MQLNKRGFPGSSEGVTKAVPILENEKCDGKWINQCNLIEAIEVVQLLKKIIKEQPEKSVGIIYSIRLSGIKEIY
ncbi:hypothetical protein B1NLA3E_04950 [Bacillus sp. 1NLA3E]|nr:hypothetical protein B1NLA3E_04950 [Bacillus sp. 1NLA3E]